MKALLIEPNCHHFEVIPGFAHLLVSLGYEVDVLMRAHEVFGDVFCRCPQLKRHMGIHTYQEGELEDAARDLQAQGSYDLLFFSSLDCWEGRTLVNRRQEFERIDESARGIFGCYHTAGHLGEEGYDDLARQGRISALSPVREERFELPEVNAHFFCDEIAPHRKSDITSIASIGVSLDYNELRLAARNLYAQNRRVTRLAFVGRRGAKGVLVHNLKALVIRLFHLKKYDDDRHRPIGLVWLPAELRRGTTTLSNVPFETLFAVVEDADFLACNIDRGYAEEFARWRTTGVRQLSLGFLKPCIIERRYAEYYGFSDENAIVYEKGMLEDALRRATGMSAHEYEAMRQALDDLRRDVERRSLDNLRQMIAGA